jgi:hypothetical protein
VLSFGDARIELMVGWTLGLRRTRESQCLSYSLRYVFAYFLSAATEDSIYISRLSMLGSGIYGTKLCSSVAAPEREEEVTATTPRRSSDKDSKQQNGSVRLIHSRSSFALVDAT